MGKLEINNSELSKKLLNIKEQIEKDKKLLSEKEGQLQLLYKQLNDSGLKTIGDVEKHIKKLTKDMDKMTVALEAGIKELEELYEW